MEDKQKNEKDIEKEDEVRADEDFSTYEGSFKNFSVVPKQVENISKALALFSKNALVQVRQPIIDPTLLTNYRNVISGFNSLAQNISLTINRVATTLSPVLLSFASTLTNITSPFLEWAIHKIDFSALFSWMEEPKRKYALYMEKMHSYKWFPFLGGNVDSVLIDEICAVLNTSRGESKRSQRRIDSVVFSYYTKTEIQKIQKEWKNAALPPVYKKLLNDCVNAYKNKQYALCSICLTTLWEGIIQYKTGNYGVHQSTKAVNEELAALMEFKCDKEVYSRFCEDYIYKHINTLSDATNEIPQRHGVAHSKYSEYPTRKLALNAILFTDFLLKLDDIVYKPTESNKKKKK